MIQNGILQLGSGIQNRGGTGADLTSVNPLLKAREIVIETDTGRMKTGDGVHRWNELEYADAGTAIIDILGFYIDEDGDLCQEEDDEEEEEADE